MEDIDNDDGELDEFDSLSLMIQQRQFTLCVGIRFGIQSYLDAFTSFTYTHTQF